MSSLLFSCAQIRIVSLQFLRLSLPRMFAWNVNDKCISLFYKLCSAAHLNIISSISFANIVANEQASEQTKRVLWVNNCILTDDSEVHRIKHCNLKCIAFHLYVSFYAKRMTCECFHSYSCERAVVLLLLCCTSALGCGFIGTLIVSSKSPYLYM